ncbi:MAG: hypothetical protein APF76_09655 [Desulfitibacter sp. BRH_c19]|nr:MAG: hypothetical protein APF76_09655 [Desulfitibacter sp. BRH_c19]
MAEVRLEQLTKSFGGPPVVSEITFTIEDGEFLVLVGPSGCGKSTTLRMIAGLEAPTSGEIYIGNKEVTSLEPKNRDIAMVFQNYALYPHKNIYDNIAFSLSLRKIKKNLIEDQVKEAAEMLGITEYLHRFPKQLSGGQRQRVALGRAIVRHPQVFLMDEPLSNLDAKLRVQMRADLIKLHQQLKTTTIYVTHDQIEAMTMGSRIAVLKDGLLQQLGTPDEIYMKPVNTFVAGFIGTPPMNFINGKLVKESEKMVFKGKEVSIEVTNKVANNFAQEEVTLGIRPECINLTDTVSPDEQDGIITGVVEIVEYIGAEVIVHVITSGQDKIVMKVSGYGRIPCSGENIKVRASKEFIHIFDADSGTNAMNL